MGHHTKNLLIVVGVVVVVILLWMMMKGNKSGYKAEKSHEPLKEEFTSMAAGALDNVGMLDIDNYDLLQGADGKDLPAPNFADLVDQENVLKEYMESKKEENVENPMERLQRIQGTSLLPRNSKNVTPYNVDVANPASSAYMVTAPRVQSLKSKTKDYHHASFIRGDIPISFFSNVCVVAKTHQGRGDLRMDGLFTPYFTSRYKKLVGKAYKNLVQDVAGAGQSSGYGGASGGVIMDSQ